MTDLERWFNRLNLLQKIVCIICPVPAFEAFLKYSGGEKEAKPIENPEGGQ